MRTANFEVESATSRSQVINWLNNLFPDLNTPLYASEEELRAQLVDGALLCEILNMLYPSFTESPRCAYDSPRQQLTNIERFSSALELMGLPSFSIEELEQGSLATVVECLLSLRDHSNSNNTEENSPDSARFSSQLRKRWKIPNDDKLTSIEVAEGNHIQGGQYSMWGGEERTRSFLESDLQDAMKNHVASGPSVASLHHVRHNLHEALHSKHGQYSEVSAGKMLEMMKSDSLNNAPTQSLMSIMNGILDESVERKSGEIPQRVAKLLRRVMQEIECRISTQAAHIKDQNNLMKSREEKYRSRTNVLETIANGINEEMKMLINQLQLIKTEKLKIEETKRRNEQDLIRLVKEKDNMECIISELRQELETAKQFYEQRCQELQCKSMETKNQLDSKTKEIELVLYDSKKKIQELEETTELKRQSWIKKENILQNCIHFQLQSMQGLRNASKSIEYEVMDSQKKWIEEINKLGLRLKVLTDAAENYHLVLAENQKLYNEVQDLKGNIRVYCRIRPFLPGQNEKSTTIDYIGENGELFLVNPSKLGKDGHRMFKFNKVFAPTASQAAVFLDVQPLIRSILDGYNVCIFAYGQTGSGKTYTMSGPNLSSMEDWGVNYRALHDLFDISQNRRNVYSYEIGVQMVEIYNEQVRDLLADEGPQKRLGIWSITQPNGLTVPEASVHPVMSTSDVLQLMQIGQANRAVGSTALNERSSRSHSVLTVHVRGMDVKTGSTSRGCLHLIDLAGSERVDRSEATGDRLKEAQHINKSLSALGDVIFALAQKNNHVPYRNSKLTQVLQSSLGGQAKTLMFVQINLDIESYSETISTLKFAERVSGVELGAARSNREGRDIKDLLEQVASLKEVMAKKDEEIEQLRMPKDTRLKSSVSCGDLHTNETLANSSLSSGNAFRSIDKTYSDPDSYYELREKHFEINVGGKDLNSQADHEFTCHGYGDFEERLSDISDDGLSQRSRSDSLSTATVEFSQFPGAGKFTVATADKPIIPFWEGIKEDVTTLSPLLGGKSIHHNVAYPFGPSEEDFVANMLTSISEKSKAPSRVYGSLSAKNGQASSRLKVKDPLKSTSTFPSTWRSTISRPIGSSLKAPKPRH